MPFDDSLNGPNSVYSMAYPGEQQEMWTMIIRNGFLTIGCQRHTFQEWWNFDNREIAKMHRPTRLALVD